MRGEITPMQVFSSGSTGRLDSLLVRQLQRHRQIVVYLRNYHDFLRKKYGNDARPAPGGDKDQWLWFCAFLCCSSFSLNHTVKYF